MMDQDPTSRNAFTLVELLVVIAIISILMGLLFIGARTIQDQAQRTKAKNDLSQIVTAVNAFYTEYGKYPIVAADTTITNNADLMYTLRAVALGANANNAINPRQIVYISPPDVKDPTSPHAGINPNNGQYYDSWGSPYRIAIDGNYDNQIANPYTASTGAGAATLNVGVIAWSAGNDGKAPDNGGTQTFTASDDVISW